MQVTFWIHGTSRDDEESFIALNNTNAAALCNWLCLESLNGCLPGSELAHRCAEKLVQPSEPGPAVILAGCIVVSGRPLDYLRARAQDLFDLAMRAGDRLICWT